MHLKIIELLGHPYYIGYSDGNKIGEIVKNCRQEGFSIDLSFEGVRGLSPRFIEGILFPLYDTFGEEEILSNINLIDISDKRRWYFGRIVESVIDIRKNPEKYMKIWEDE
jgi:hypothetical protein